MNVIGCQKTSDNTSSSDEQSEISFQGEDKNESEILENSSNISLAESEDDSFEADLEEKSEEKSELVDYSWGGGIVLPDDEW